MSKSILFFSCVFVVFNVSNRLFSMDGTLEQPLLQLIYLTPSQDMNVDIIEKEVGYRQKALLTGYVRPTKSEYEYDIVQKIPNDDKKLGRISLGTDELVTKLLHNVEAMINGTQYSKMINGTQYSKIVCCYMKFNDSNNKQYFMKIENIELPKNVNESIEKPEEIKFNKIEYAQKVYRSEICLSDNVIKFNTKQHHWWDGWKKFKLSDESVKQIKSFKAVFTMNIKDTNNSWYAVTIDPSKDIRNPTSLKVFLIRLKIYLGITVLGIIFLIGSRFFIQSLRKNFI